ncbi:cyclopropane fatty acyl phospholipid synthase [Desulfobacca acetoxidans]|uniref:Cyclopropane-fatty-acyl-phospholipid synthase n=1 Tax=Desulfobacca acetoxidans (strain ATCC 700848 / DSM 11109 / ASRB2) TaxID=880072 RepID=F2NI15_DESAR|nr:cyclopropane fatty acyl phospholipid synthase [Desulfobacca acetoxidans]AEB09641.1 Cyclopropane-fatty-acyl-phospholipid synthase [Desulfobacca acetoxidans DSM 11109]
MRSAKLIVQGLLNLADVHINGDRAWDMQVYDDRLYSRVLREGSLGLGEAYMDGWWEVQELDEFFNRVLRADLEQKVTGNWKTLLWIIGQRVMNRQKKSVAHHIGEHHYDIGNDLYTAMLDRRKVYSCGYWCHASNLDQAQEAKLDLVCRKLDLQPGQKILDIGCGWGSLAKFAAEKYQVSVIGITVSKEQLALGRELCAGLPIELRFQDYRDIEGEYDHIVSLGMVEHVGYKNFRTYMQTVYDHLKPEGLFLLHTIGSYCSSKETDPWIGKYIFPHSLVPSAVQLTRAMEKLFIIEDWHNFGLDYSKTLMAWFKNFDANWAALRPKYGDRFYRMWKYYLHASAGTFRSRKNSVWQIVLSKGGLPEGYESVR